MQKADVMKNSERLITYLNDQGEVWQGDIDIIIRNLKSDLDKMESNHQDVLNKQEDEITSTMSEIRLIIAKLKKLLSSEDTYIFFEYKSTNAKFKKLNSKIRTSLPNLWLPLIYIDQLIGQFGSLSALSFTTKEQYTIVLVSGPETDGWSTGYHIFRHKIRVWLMQYDLLNDEEIWTCNEDTHVALWDSTFSEENNLSQSKPSQTTGQMT